MATVTPSHNAYFAAKIVIVVEGSSTVCEIANCNVPHLNIEIKHNKDINGLLQSEGS